jgi:hypothetical protein
MTWSEEARRESIRVRKLNALLHKKYEKSFAYRMDPSLADKVKVLHPVVAPTSEEEYQKFYRRLLKEVPAANYASNINKQLPKARDWAALDAQALAKVITAHKSYNDSLKARFRKYAGPKPKTEDQLSAKWVVGELEWSFNLWGNSVEAAAAGHGKQSDQLWDKALRGYMVAKRNAGSFDDEKLANEILAMTKQLNAIRKAKTKPAALAMRWKGTGALNARQEGFLRKLLYMEMDELMGSAGARTYGSAQSSPVFDDLAKLGYVEVVNGIVQVTPKGRQALRR